MVSVQCIWEIHDMFSNQITIEIIKTFSMMNSFSSLLQLKIDVIVIGKNESVDTFITHLYDD